MKKIFIINICSFLIISVSWAGSIDPFAFIPQHNSTNIKASVIETQDSSHEAPTQTNEQMVSVFISTSNPDSTIESIARLGGVHKVKLSSIITAEVSVSILNKIADLPEVSYIEAAKPISIKNDNATYDINSIEANRGNSLPEAYDGTGVIVGIIDTGIDYTHPAFKDSDGNNRILFIWDQKKPGNRPSEIAHSYGYECGIEEIRDEECPITDKNGHGTHVAATASGNDQNYPGVAPNANIIAVRYKSEIEISSGKITPVFSTTICEAVYYVFSKASQLGMPAVINLSLGTHIGPHDGTSLFEQCLSELVDGSAGRAIVAAAGNEYPEESEYKGIHAGGTVNDTEYLPFVIREPSKSNFFYLDLWCEVDSDMSFALGTYEAGSSDPISLGEEVDLGDSSNQTFFGNLGEYTIDATERQNPNNQKAHIGIMIRPQGNAISNETLILSISGKGKCDGWLYPDKPSNIVNFTSLSSINQTSGIVGSTEKTITSPATSESIISVAGYATRREWIIEDRRYTVGYRLDSILPFSSSGPTANYSSTTIKPEISAPGGMIISARSKDANYTSDERIDDNHSISTGTSMATPFVSGTIALMLQAVPNLTVNDIKTCLMTSADSDDNTGDVPNYRWGYGKLNTWKAVNNAVINGGSGEFDPDATLAPPQNDSSGSGGCSLNPNANIPIALYWIILISLFFIRQFRCILSNSKNNDDNLKPNS